MIPILALENPISFINKIKYELSKVNKEKITLNDTNGKKNLDAFNEKVEFNIHIIEHNGNDDWVENTILNAIEILENDEIPESAEGCEHCKYFNNRKVTEDRKAI